MSQKIRVGIIGANPNGRWGTMAHLPALQALNEYEVTAVATNHLETARQTASQFGIPHACENPQALVEHPDVDMVSVCVRVPYHFELVEKALNAGKHVYCEWPLAKTTEEAQQLVNMATGKDVVAMIGLQGRHSPELNYVKDLIENGEIGKVCACALNHSLDWGPQLPPHLTYIQDFSSGAHMLSIPGGHSIDTLRWLFGDIREMAAFVTTLVKEIDIAGSGEKFPRTSPDQVMISAVTDQEVYTTVRIQGSSPVGVGISLEINGEKGDLLIKAGPGSRGIQMSDLGLFKSVAGGNLEPVTVPEEYFGVPDVIRHNPALNIAKSYQNMARAIHQGETVTDFSTALELHKLLDRVVESSKNRKFLHT